MHRPFTHQSSSHCTEAVTAAYFLDIGLDRLTPSHDLSALQICQLAKRLGPERAGKLEVPWNRAEAGLRRAKVVYLLPLCTRTTIGITIGDCIRFIHSASENIVYIDCVILCWLAIVCQCLCMFGMFVCTLWDTWSMCNQCSFLKDGPGSDQITTEFCWEFGHAETWKQIEQLLHVFCFHFGKL